MLCTRLPNCAGREDYCYFRQVAHCADVFCLPRMDWLGGPHKIAIVSRLLAHVAQELLNRLDTGHHCNNIISLRSLAKEHPEVLSAYFLRRSWRHASI